MKHACPRLLHPYQVLRAIYYGQRWRLKRLLKIPDKPKTPVIDSGIDLAFKRHHRICSIADRVLSLASPPSRRIACEIGPGDCLSVADLLLGSGFGKVYLVERSQFIIDERQVALLGKLSSTGLPNRGEAVISDPVPRMNTEKITVIPEFFENAHLPEKVDFIFSHDVVEHVEDLGAFFKGCREILQKDGLMVHKFDLSGHEFFEDPMPPLDFQTYPDWLYDLMFPRYRRACRWFLDEIVGAARYAGFSNIEITLINSAERGYVADLLPHLRLNARSRSIEELMPLDVLLTARGY